MPVSFVVRKDLQMLSIFENLLQAYNSLVPRPIPRFSMLHTAKEGLGAKLGIQHGLFNESYT